MDFAPFIPIPTVDRRSFKSRYAVQEFYEEMPNGLSANIRIEKLSIPIAPLDCKFPEKDFGWFIGVGTLPVILEKCRFVEGSNFTDTIEVRTTGQAEYEVKPGICVRQPVVFYRENEPVNDSFIQVNTQSRNLYEPPVSTSYRGMYILAVRPVNTPFRSYTIIGRTVDGI